MRLALSKELNLKSIDMIGKSFGLLDVQELSEIKSGGKRCFVCVCKCGNEKIIRGDHLRNGRTTSCGCITGDLISNKKRSHGMSRTRPYRIWRNMINRCHYEKYHEKKYYADKGITVCDKWRKSFDEFINDMGVPSNNLTIDRVDNTKGYYKENCRWATYKEQSANKSHGNRYVSSY